MKKIEIIKCLNDNYSYLIYEKETNTVSIVDPSEFSSCEKKKLVNIKNWIYTKYPSSCQIMSVKHST